MNNADKPINPVEVSGDGEGNIQGIQTGNYSGWETGLTKREHFSGLAMQAFASNAEITKQLIIKNKGRSIAKDIAALAIGCADELLKQLETTQPENIEIE